MKQLKWRKLNDTYVALNESGQLVGYLAHIIRTPRRQLETFER